MRKSILTIVLALVPIATLIGGTASIAHAHHSPVPEESSDFDCLVDGNHLCGPRYRTRAEARAKAMSTETNRCVVVSVGDAIGIECNPIDPTVHADGMPATPLSQAQDQKLRTVKAQPNFTG